MLFTTRHSENGPHGDGKQGSVVTGVTTGAIKIMIKLE